MGAVQTNIYNGIYSAWIGSGTYITAENSTRDFTFDFDTFGSAAPTIYKVQSTFFYDGVRVIKEDTINESGSIDYTIGGTEAASGSIHFRITNTVSLPPSSAVEIVSAGVNFVAPDTPSIDTSLLTGFEYRNATFGIDNLDFSSETDRQMIFTYDGNDVVVGGSADDIIYGFDGDDTLNGGDGNDLIYGGSDDDTLTSGGGNTDVLNGGDGADHYIISSNTDNTSIIDDNTDTNTLRFNGISLSDEVETIRAADDLLLSFTDSSNKVRNILIKDAYSGSTLQTSVDNLTLDDGTFNITTYLSSNGEDFEATGDEAIWGTTQSETTSFTDTVNGGFAFLDDGNDTATGSQGADFISGGNGADYILGGDGNDRLYGGNDNDQILGEDGDDRLYGGDGSLDQLNGGAGNDKIYGEEGADWLHGHTGNDELFGGDGDDVLNGEEGIDYYDGGDGVDHVTFIGSSGGVNVSLLSNKVYDDGHGNDEDIINVEGVQGTYYDDVISGNNLANWLNAGNGNDIINGFDGDDTLIGDSGEDMLNGGSGTDTAIYSGFIGGISFNFEDDSTLIRDQYGFYDTISNIEVINATGVADTMIGGVDDDTFHGNFGDDFLVGGSGSDSLYGGFDDDTFRYTLSKNSGEVDYYDGGLDNDSIHLYFTSGELDSLVETDLVNYQSHINSGSGSSFAFTQFGLTANGFENLHVYENGVERNVNAFAVDDHLSVAVSQTLNGNVLNDNGDGSDDAIDGVTVTTTSPITTSLGNSVTLTASGSFTYIASSSVGTDTFAYEIEDGRGNTDTATATIYIQSVINGTSSAETVNGDSDPNQINGLEGNDTLNGNGGADTINGGDGNDYVRAGNGDDIIYGGDGNDSLYGDAGNDFIYGEAGNDTFVSKAGNTYFDGGAGFNTANYTVLGFSGGINANLETGIVTKGDGSTDTLVNVERLLGTASNDVIQGGDLGETLDGKAGNDTIYGGLGNDFIYGGDGDDIIDGQGGLDTLKAGSGNDTMYGGSQTDSLWGEDGNDTIYGLGGDDIFIGSAGNDNFYGGADLNKANYNFMGGAITANLDLSSGQVTKHDSSVDNLTDIQVVMGSAYNDTITGGYNINIQGHDGDDILTGGSGADYIYGQGDDDTIHGAGYNDRLYGGSGDDTFIFNRSGGADTIVNDDSVSTDDTVDFGVSGTAIDHDQLWFEQSGNHLLVSVIGTNDTVTLENWYTTGYTVDNFESTDGYTLSAGDVSTLVTAMASETKPSFGQTDMPSQTQTNLDSTLASVWAA